MSMKFIAFVLSFYALAASQALAETFSVKSPDGKIEVSVSDGSRLEFSVKADGKTVLEPFAIGMKTDGGDFGKNVKVRGSTVSTRDENISTVYGIRSIVKDNCNQLSLDFKDFRLIVRAYNDSVAYRFATSGKGEIVVLGETLDFPVSANEKFVGHAVNGAMTSHEEFFVRGAGSADMKKYHSFTLPFVVYKNGFVVAFVESDVFDYPAIRLCGGSGSAKSWLAKAPKSFKQKRNFIRMVDETFDYIAKTKASREFPWRGFVIGRTDADLADNDTVYKLAEGSRIKDVSWIKPGLCAWEWWSDWQLEGVNFKGGVNEQTYRYYIDFAAENRIPYVLFDAGWLTGVDVGQMDSKIDDALLSGKTVIDIPALIAYAHSKNVKIILWTLGQTVDKYGEKAFDIIKSWGADGVKIDFVDRDDQQAQCYYERMARLAAERKMVVDFHGCAKPTGIQRTYPNVVNFEAVRGCEFNKFSGGIPPSHNIDLVFTRMLQGPMDYTPGALCNRGKQEFQKSYSYPQMMGTRSHMMAMYVLFYAPVQMLCDSASNYKKVPDILHFISNCPTSWDDTKVLEGKMGQYVVVARRKGEVWYIGGMSDWSGKKVEIDLSKILTADTDYKAEIIRDSKNSSKNATDYKREVKDVTSESKLKFEMASGGGFVARLSPKKIPVIDDIVKFFTGEDDDEDDDDD